MKIYDTVIIGGGPAGQTAALYLARFMRSVVVIDRGTSRTNTYELNENYLGFVHGIHARQFVELGKAQAERFGVTFVSDEVARIGHASNPDPGQPRFQVEGIADTYRAKTLILATGVTDLYPNIPSYKEYLGKSLFWCITCDGLKTSHKKLVVIGDTDEAACTALQFKLYTNDITLLTNYDVGSHRISSLWQDRLAMQHVRLIEGSIANLIGQNGFISSIELETNESVPAEILFNLQGAVPNNALATELGVVANEEGYLETDDEQRTSVPFVYAAGDVTRRFSHQIVTACHEGSMAAQAANYDLYEEWQRM